jgi:hypothetical protein
MVLDVKSVDRLLGTPVPYAYAIKAGPWIFLTGHEAYDWETGTSDEVTGPPGFPLHGRHRSRREGDFILRRMRRVLSEFGSDLSHAIRLDQYYPLPRAVASYHLARHAEFGDYIPPSTSVVMERCFASERWLWVSRGNRLRLRTPAHSGGSFGIKHAVRVKPASRSNGWRAASSISSPRPRRPTE